MLIRKPHDIRPSEITDKALYTGRRRFMKSAAAAALAAGAPGWLGSPVLAAANPRLSPIRKSPYSTSEPMNSLKDISGYVNFYEFGTDKTSPVKRAQSLRTRPWTVKVTGDGGRST